MEFVRRIAVLRPILNDLAADVICLQEVDAQKSPPQEGADFSLLTVSSAIPPTKVTTARRAFGLERMRQDVAYLRPAMKTKWAALPRQMERCRFEGSSPRGRWTSPGSAPSSTQKSQCPTALRFTSSTFIYALRALSLFPIRVKVTAASQVEPGQRDGLVAAQKREGQAFEARLFIERLFDSEPNALIAVCGDLNSEEHDTPARLLVGIPDEDAAEPSPRKLIPLADRVEEARRFSVVHAGRPVLLDHILASRTLAACCMNVAIMNEGLQDEVMAEELILGSLHAPITASFDLGKS